MTVAEFRKLALGLDGVAEHPHFEKTAFHRNGKIFATLDQSYASVVLKFTATEQEAFAAIDASNVSPVKGYWGTKGWTNVSLSGIEKRLLQDMLKTSYDALDKPAKKKSRGASKKPGVQK
jgi:predicted DNA-binding protein (MmcQ/YjbR family)